MGTKEKIFEVSLRLFAEHGFDAVSVRDIADEVGITKGGLYRHYTDKQAIFEAILERMEMGDAAQAEKADLPIDAKSADNGEEYAAATPEQMLSFSKDMWRYWTLNEFACRFRRMLTVEQFKNERMMSLYQQYIVAGPIGYLADMMEEWGIEEPYQAAAAFYAPMVMMYSYFDGAAEKESVILLGDRLIEDAYKSVKEKIVCSM